MSGVRLQSHYVQVDLRVRRSANLTLYRLWQLPLVDVWELLNGFLFRSPAGNARRLIARARFASGNIRLSTIDPAQARVAVGACRSGRHRLAILLRAREVRKPRQPHCNS